MADGVIEQLWRLVDALRLPANFFGEIVIKVQQGKVNEVAVTQKHRHSPDAKPPPDGEGRVIRNTEAPRE